MSDMPINSKPESFTQAQPEPLWTRPFLLLTLSYFLLFMCLQMLLSPFPAYVTERFNPGDVQVSLTTTLFALAAIAARFATAALMKKISRHWLLFSGLLLGLLCTVAYPFTDTFGFLLVLRIGFGIGFGMGSTVMATMVSEIIPPRRMGEGIGYFGLSTSLAMSLGPLIGLSMLEQYGFVSLSLWGATAVALSLPLLMGIGGALKNRQSHKTTPQGEERQKAKATASNEEKSGEEKPFLFVLLPALLNILMAVTYGGLLGFLALFGQEQKIESIGLFFLFNALTILAVRPIAGRMFDRKGHGAVLIPGGLLLSLSLLTLSFADHMPILIVAALLYGLGMGSVQPTLQAWMLRESDPSRYATTNSLFYNSTDLGVAVGSLCLGMIASGSSYAMMYRWSSLIMVGFLLAYTLIRIIVARASGSTKKSALSSGG